MEWTCTQIKKNKKKMFLGDNYRERRKIKITSAIEARAKKEDEKQKQK